MSKKPQSFSSHEQAVKELSEAIESLEPLAHLLCASRLLVVGSKPGSFSMHGYVRGEPDAIGIELCQNWPLVTMWTSQKAMASASAPRPLCAWLGDRESDQWSALFVAMAFKAQLAAERIGAAGWERSMEILNIKAAPGRPGKALGWQTCSQWLANAAIGYEPLEELRRQAKADGFKVAPELDAIIEAREIGKFAPAPENQSEAGSGPRL